MKKVDIFTEEYQYIQEERYCDNLKKLVEMLPDYFFHVPASSTGKYHPSFALNEGGLVRHTKVAVRIAFELYQTEAITGKFTSQEKDLILIALLLHDGWKHGRNESSYVLAEHPKIMYDFLMEQQEQLTFTKDELQFISDAVLTHSGPWNQDYRGKEILPIPHNRFQKFVHMCDYLASRKFLDVKFDDQDHICNQ